MRYFYLYIYIYTFFMRKMIIWMYCLTLKLCCLVAVYHGHANLIHLFHVHRWVLIVIPCFIARDDWLLLQSRLFLVSTPQETDSLNTLLSPLGAVQGHARTAASLCPEPPTLRFSPSSLLTGWAQKGHVSHTGVQAGGRCFLVQVYDFIYGPISPAVANKKLWFKTGTTHDHLSNFVLISIVCVFVLPPPFSSSWFVYHLVSYLSNSSSLPISPIKMENSCAFRCCLFIFGIRHMCFYFKFGSRRCDFNRTALRFLFYSTSQLCRVSMFAGDFQFFISLASQRPVFPMILDPKILSHLYPPIF